MCFIPAEACICLIRAQQEAAVALKKTELEKAVAALRKALEEDEEKKARKARMQANLDATLADWGRRYVPKTWGSISGDLSPYTHEQLMNRPLLFSKPAVKSEEQPSSPKSTMSSSIPPVVTAEAILPAPQPTPPKRYKVTLEISEAEARGIQELCYWIGGCQKTSPRRVFDRLSAALYNAGSRRGAPDEFLSQLFTTNVFFKDNTV